MKLTLVGRPAHIEVRGQVAVMLMQGAPAPALAMGLPAPTGAPLRWTVLVGLRQWNRVKEALAAHEEDKLVIEGYPTMQGDRHVLLAQSCVSVLQQRAQAGTAAGGTDPARRGGRLHMSLTPPAIPDARAALAALAELEGAASLLRQVLTCEPQASPDVLARLAGLLQDTAKDLTVWATWLELPDEETPP